jgi:hypothetical protein
MTPSRPQLSNIWADIPRNAPPIAAALMYGVEVAIAGNLQNQNNVFTRSRSFCEK